VLPPRQRPKATRCFWPTALVAAAPVSTRTSDDLVKTSDLSRWSHARRQYGGHPAVSGKPNLRAFTDTRAATRSVALHRPAPHGEPSDGRTLPANCPGVEILIVQYRRFGCGDGRPHGEAKLPRHRHRHRPAQDRAGKIKVCRRKPQRFAGTPIFRPPPKPGLPGPRSEQWVGMMAPRHAGRDRRQAQSRYRRDSADF